jgi:DNA-directed RNA polymerase specialized sigma24 family protein
MDSERFAQAYQRGYDLTVRFLLSRGVQRDDATEVAQAAWVRGWERLAQLRNESLVTTWVNTIALNGYRSMIRREPVNEALLETHGRSVGIDLAAIDIGRVLTLCRPADRSLLEKCINGFTTAEMALEQGVTETAIRIRLLRARRDARFRCEKRKVSLRRARHVSSMPEMAAA